MVNVLFMQRNYSVEIKYILMVKIINNVYVGLLLDHVVFLLLLTKINLFFSFSGPCSPWVRHCFFDIVLYM